MLRYPAPSTVACHAAPTGSARSRMRAGSRGFEDVGDAAGRADRRRAVCAPRRSRSAAGACAEGTRPGTWRTGAAARRRGDGLAGLNPQAAGTSAGWPMRGSTTEDGHGVTCLKRPATARTKDASLAVVRRMDRVAAFRERSPRRAPMGCGSRLRPSCMRFGPQRPPPWVERYGGSPQSARTAGRRPGPALRHQRPPPPAHGARSRRRARPAAPACLSPSGLRPASLVPAPKPLSSLRADCRCRPPRPCGGAATEGVVPAPERASTRHDPVARTGRAMRPPAGCSWRAGCGAPRARRVCAREGDDASPTVSDPVGAAASARGSSRPPGSRGPTFAGPRGKAARSAIEPRGASSPVP